MPWRKVQKLGDRPHVSSLVADRRRSGRIHSPFMLAALTIGHHFSISVVRNWQKAGNSHIEAVCQ
jgi:hypothetical protein